MSAWLEQAQAAAASNRRVAYVARLALLDEPLTRVALTEHGGYGHVDVWAYPGTLLGAVVDVIRIRA